MQTEDLKNAFEQQSKNLNAKLKGSFADYLQIQQLKDLYNFANTKKKKEGKIFLY